MAKKVLTNLDMQYNQLINAELGNSAGNPSTLIESLIWYDTVTHKPMYYDGTSACEFGRVYSAGTGVTIGNDNSITVTDYDKLIKNSGGTGNLGIYASSIEGYGAVSIGRYSSVYGESSIAIGGDASVGDSSTDVIGSIQLGPGSNEESGSMYIALFERELMGVPSFKNYKLLDGPTGLIPDARISSNIARTSSVPTKISDLTDDTSTYPVDKADTLTGLTASVSELNIMDGVTVTASDINSVTSKIGLTSLSIDSGSTNYLGYNNSNGKFSAKVDTTVTASSSKLITSGAVDTAIKNAITNVYKAQGTVAFASLPTLSSSIEGYVYNVSDAFTTTSDFVEGSGKSYPAGTNVVCINTSGTTYKWDVLAGSVDTSTFITASSTNTLTNKTIDADDNTISDLTTSNFKSGVIQTTVRSTSSASDSALVTEKAVATAISGSNKKITATNGALTQSGGVCTWTISNTLGTADVLVQVIEVSTNNQVITDVSVGSSTITIKINSSSNISANTYKAIIMG